MNRVATEYSGNVSSTATGNFDCIVLTPKANIPATKLVIKIEGTGNDAELTIGCSVNGSAASANQKTVQLSSSGVTVEFDLHSFGAHGGIGAYNGGTGSDFGNKLFGSAAGGDVSDGENYIKLVFTNRANAQFKVTFEGYYDK